MSIKFIESDLTCVDAGYARIRNVFGSNDKICMSFSGGKDSIALAGLLINLLKIGDIDGSKLTVVFIDEEAIFPDVERVVIEYMGIFKGYGCNFVWYAMEFVHFNCFNQLASDTSFICFDRNKKERWVRKPPDYAVTFDYSFKPRIDSYQDFMKRKYRDYCQLVGIRTQESVHRVYNMINRSRSGNSKDNYVFPIYDWTTDDVWRFIKDNKLTYPDEYKYMWQVGSSLKDLRISQFFSVDTAKILVKMQEFYPDLIERISKREPNAYMVLLYYDTELFRKSNRNKKTDDNDIDYKEKVINMLEDIEKNFNSETARGVAKKYLKMVVQNDIFFTKKEWRRCYLGLIGGDPKLRTLRAILIDLSMLRSKNNGYNTAA